MRGFIRLWFCSFLLITALCGILEIFIEYGGTKQTPFLDGLMFLVFLVSAGGGLAGLIWEEPK